VCTYIVLAGDGSSSRIEPSTQQRYSSWPVAKLVECRRELLRLDAIGRRGAKPRRGQSDGSGSTLEETVCVRWQGFRMRGRGPDNINRRKATGKHTKRRKDGWGRKPVMGWSNQWALCGPFRVI
jgi:hypothetical protein